MKGFSFLIFGKLGLVELAFLLAFGLGGCLASCSKEEPVGHIPAHGGNGGSGDSSDSGENGSGSNGENGGTNGENGGSSNGGSSNGVENGGGEVVEGESRIVGDWVRSDGLEKISFKEDGWFGGYSAVGDEGEWELCEEGHYVYKDLSRRVWIETFVEGEDRSVVYRTVFGDDDTLTLWSEDNRRRDFKRL